MPASRSNRALKKRGTNARTSRAASGRASSKTTSRATRTSRAVDGLTGLTEQLVNRIIKPLGLVLLTRERIQETLDDAAERGRITRSDANDLVTELVQRGRLAENRLGDLELADVVQQRAERRLGEVVVAEPEPNGDRHREPADRLGVVGRVPAPLPEPVGERGKRARVLARLRLVRRPELFGRRVHPCACVLRSGRMGFLLP